MENTINKTRAYRLAQISLKYAERFNELDEPALAKMATTIAKECLEDVGVNLTKEAKLSPVAPPSTKKPKGTKCHRCKSDDGTVKTREKFHKDLCNACSKVTKYISTDGKYVFPPYKKEEKASFGFDNMSGGGSDESWSAGGQDSDAPDFFSDTDVEPMGGGMPEEDGLTIRDAKRILLQAGCPYDELEQMDDKTILDEAESILDEGDTEDEEMCPHGYERDNQGWIDHECPECTMPRNTTSSRLQEQNPTRLSINDISKLLVASNFDRGRY